MNQYKFVSVIIPVYNNQIGLSRCLTYFLQQKYPFDFFEIIVVDNGSDDPVMLPENFPIKVEVLNCTTPGSYSARNEGVKKARGEILAFIDSDCFPDAAWISKGVEYLMQRNLNVIIGGEVEMVPSAKKTPTEIYQLMTGFGQKENIEINFFTATANMMCSKRIFEEIGPFNQNLLSGGDREWCWRARSTGILILYCRDVIVYTEPRRKLSQAITQARRVASGRRDLIKSDMFPRQVILPRRSKFQSFLFIFSYPGVKFSDKTKVFFVACCIYVFSVIEKLKLFLGFKPERQ